MPSQEFSFAVLGSLPAAVAMLPALQPEVASSTGRAAAGRARGLPVYYPPWWNLAREDGHQPVWPEVYARMPTELQALTRHKVGRTRADVCEEG
jgi:hypothetical protein